MRTTLNLDVEAIEIVRAQAAEREVALGVAASDLIRNGARFELRAHEINGLPVFDVPADFPLVTNDDVRRILDRE